MRTVTFAELDLVAYLREHFVTVWHNQTPDRPGLFGQQDDSTPQERKAYSEGGGGANVRTYFCAPDGKLIYELEGYWACQRYLREAFYARALAVRLGTLPDSGRTQLNGQDLLDRRSRLAKQLQEAAADSEDPFDDSATPDRALAVLEKNLSAAMERVGQPVILILQEAEHERRWSKAFT